MLKGLVPEPATAAPSISFTKKFKTHDQLAVNIWLTAIGNAVVATKSQVLKNYDPERKSTC